MVLTQRERGRGKEGEGGEGLQPMLGTLKVIIRVRSTAGALFS